MTLSDAVTPKLSVITSVDQLAELYGTPAEGSLVKEVDYLTPEYRALIEASPFAVLGTSGPEGLDCSPRGDQSGWVRIVDDRTLMLPDRRGNNRTDSLRNIIRDPRVALLFLIPGSGTTLRLNGHAFLTTDPDVLASFAVEDKSPRSVIVISVRAVYFQCARAIVRADLWNPDKYVDATCVPTAGQMLATVSQNRLGGADYDRAWPERAKTSMW
jgi:PPOX class probable FMN-dependent enzyme